MRTTDDVTRNQNAPPPRSASDVINFEREVADTEMREADTARRVYSIDEMETGSM